MVIYIINIYNYNCFCLYNLTFLILKFPQHLVIDFTTKNVLSSTKYWALNTISNTDLQTSQKSFFLFKFFLVNNKLKWKFFDQKTLKNKTLRSKKLNIFEKKMKILEIANSKKFKKNLAKDYDIKFNEIKKKFKYIPQKKNKVFKKILFKKSKYDLIFLSNFLLKFSSTKFNINNNTNKSFFKYIFDINFLKKEKIYTKLKYSRVPQYDIVSGGSAALLAGFLGFLICEKFGFELLDSGDFYFLFMYIVFVSFALRLFIKIFSTSYNNWSIISLKWFVNYIFTLFNLLKFIFKNYKF